MDLLNMNMEKTRVGKQCGVPQCYNYRKKNSNISLHRVPKIIKENEILKKRWMHNLKMKKEFSKNFLICSSHFLPKYLLRPLHSSSKKVFLSTAAIPTENIPTSSVVKRSTKRRPKRMVCKLDAFIKSNANNEYESEHSENSAQLDKEVQCSLISSDAVDKEVQVSCVYKQYFITSLWDTEAKVRTMTGIPSLAILNKLVEICSELLHDSHLMSIRDRILLTMRKIKSNVNFAELAVDFDSALYSVKRHFSETVQLLAKVLGGLIYWQSHEENMKNLPKYFENFSNVITVLDCMEIETATFGCLTCCASDFSHYKSQHIVKVLIGLAPSGLLNYISTAVISKTSDKAKFNLKTLLTKLKPGDAVMVDEGFLINDELEKAGVELIKPNFDSLNESKRQHRSEIPSARVHVERRIEKMKKFKILEDKVPESVLPYIDDVFTVIGAISNLGNPILKDSEFL